MIASGELGEIIHYKGRFFSMYGSDELGLLSWRFKFDQAGYGVSSDILSHSVSLAQFLIGDIAEVVGMRETTIKQRPLPTGNSSHYSRGKLVILRVKLRMKILLQCFVDSKMEQQVLLKQVEL